LNSRIVRLHRRLLELELVPGNGAWRLRRSLEAFEGALVALELCIGFGALSAELRRRDRDQHLAVLHLRSAVDLHP
jgi:hypothetical protein